MGCCQLNNDKTQEMQDENVNECNYKTKNMNFNSNFSNLDNMVTSDSNIEKNGISMGKFNLYTRKEYVTTDRSFNQEIDKNANAVNPSFVTAKSEYSFGKNDPSTRMSIRNNNSENEVVDYNNNLKQIFNIELKKENVKNETSIRKQKTNSNFISVKTKEFKDELTRMKFSRENIQNNELNENKNTNIDQSKCEIVSPENQSFKEKKFTSNTMIEFEKLGKDESNIKEKIEDFSNSSSFNFNDNNFNDLVDSYEHSKEIFDYLNDIRLLPRICIDTIEFLISQIMTDENVDYLEIEKLPFFGGGIMKGKYHLKNGKKGLKDLLSLIESISNNTYEPILWSEKVYQKCELNLLTYNSLHINYSEDEEKNILSDVAKNPFNLKNHIRGILEGSFIPSITCILMLSEETNHVREAILTENFDVGSCCYNYSEEEFPKGMTMLVLGIKKQREERLLEVKNINKNEIDIDDPIFDYIKYKNEIVSGEFRVENGILTAIFNLENNTVKIERIII